MEPTRNKQIAGNHYRVSPLQPWDIVLSWGLNFWQGNVLKYLLRAPYKAGKEDFEKAKHYLEYLIEHYDELFPKSTTDNETNLQQTKGRKRGKL
jgi:hypothetical protein